MTEGLKKFVLRGEGYQKSVLLYIAYPLAI